MWQYFQYIKTYLIIKRKYWIDRLSRKKGKHYVPFVILCEPRSGSTLLHTYLNSHSQIISFGEVLREEAERSNQNPNEEFIDRVIFKPHAGKLKAIGLKLFYEYYESDVYRKCFEVIIQQPNIRIIHLIRNNTLQTYVSLKLAQATHVWSAINKSGENLSIEIDTSDYKNFVESHRKHLTLFSKLFSQHEMLTISYEDLVNDTSETLRSIQRFLKVDEQSLFSLLKKQNVRPLEKIVSNYRDIENELDRIDKDWILDRLQ